MFNDDFIKEFYRIEQLKNEPKKKNSTNIDINGLRKFSKKQEIEKFKPIFLTLYFFKI